LQGDTKLQSLLISPLMICSSDQWWTSTGCASHNLGIGNFPHLTGRIHLWVDGTVFYMVCRAAIIKFF